MADHDKYIEELLRYLSFSLETEERWEKAVRALVAERDALKQRVAELEAALKPSDRDLRERLVCAALQGAARDAHMHHEASSMGTRAVYIVDAAIAALRKGDSDGK